MATSTQASRHLIHQRANRQWEAGNLKSAFRLFLAGAKAGEVACQNILGTFYSDGLGIKPNREKALYWYRVAYRRGDFCAAHNLGILFRDEGNPKAALKWFERAVKRGLIDTNLDLARIYLDSIPNHKKAIYHLRMILKAEPLREVSRDSQAKARHILKKLKVAVPRLRAIGREWHRSVA